MTKEQEKAIERCKELIKPEHTNWIGISNQEAIRELLNMLKEKDKEIEHQIEKRNNQKTELAILNEKQKEMNKLINTVKSYKGQMKKEIKRIKSLEKEAQGYFEKMMDKIHDNLMKDEIIDLMAEKIFQEGIVWDDKEDVKQYFKSKAEKE